MSDIKQGKKPDNVQKPLVTGDMTIKEVVTKYPNTFAVFMKYNLHCVGCHISEFETVAQGAAGHGIAPDELVDELNKAAKQKGETDPGDSAKKDKK